ncbi:hypothetical protein THAOC_24335, partial [Thalassiosira oceanica]
PQSESGGRAVLSAGGKDAGEKGRVRSTPAGCLSSRGPPGEAPSVFGHGDRRGLYSLQGRG